MSVNTKDIEVVHRVFRRESGCWCAGRGRRPW